MAATVKYISRTHNAAIVKVTASGADSGTITLNDLIMTGQTVGSPKVNIGRVVYSLASTASISRGGTTVYNLAGSYEFNGMVGTDEGNTSDVVVTFAGAGTIILELKKIDGYSAIMP